MAKIEYMQSTFCSDLKPRARLVLQCLILLVIIKSHTLFCSIYANKL